MKTSHSIPKYYDQLRGTWNCSDVITLFFAVNLTFKPIFRVEKMVIKKHTSFC